MNKPPILYFCSNGLGENLQASPAMRALKREFHVIALCRSPIHAVIHPDCYNDLITFRNDDAVKFVPEIIAALAAANKSKTTDLELTPWTAHLDPQDAIHAALVARGLIYEHRERKGPGAPGSASRCFYHKVNGPIPEGLGCGIIKMSAAEPDVKREGDYDILVSSGSAEKCRRLPELQQVMLCNQLMELGFRVCLQTAADRPEKLHPRCGVALNRWNLGTIEQLKELVWGVRLVIGPDSGTNHLALAYGKKLIFLESREAYTAVVDPVYMDTAQYVYKSFPDCLKNCAARRDNREQWPAAGSKAASPGYPHNLECFNLPEVPCLKFTGEEISAIVDRATHMIN